MQKPKNVDSIVCSILGGCPIEDSQMISDIRVGDGAHHINPQAEQVVLLTDGAEIESPWLSEDRPTPGLRLLFLFQDNYRPFGEIHTRDGAFARAVFSRDGEEAMGDRMQEWQIRGVPRVTRAAHLPALVETRVPFRSPHFHVVVSHWCGSQGMHVIDVPVALLGVWQRAIDRSNSDKERFEFLNAASSLSLSDLADFLSRPSPKKAAPKKRVQVRRSASSQKKKKVRS